MTTIAAAVIGDTVHMAADSASIDGSGRIWLRHPTDPKIHTRQVPHHPRPVLLATAGHGALAALCRHDLTWDGYPDHAVDEWAHRIAQQLDVLARDHHATDRDGDVDGSALAAVHDRIWLLSGGFATACGPLASLGSGGAYALGALDALSDVRQIRPGDLDTAVEIAARWDDGTRGPIVHASTASP